MLKTRFVAGVGTLALGLTLVGSSAAQTPAPKTPPAAQSPAAQTPAQTPAPSAGQAARPASAVAGGTVAVVVDPETKSAVVVPINPHAGMPEDVNATLAALYATGKVRPDQVSQIVVRRKGRISEVIASPPVPNNAP